MTLEQLRIFVAVARLQHVTRAAEVLNLTQSAVSAAVQALESQHGVTFFDRIGRGIALNEAGRLFLPRAEALLARAREAETWLADLRGGEGGSLRLQASQTVASYFLPRHLIAFQSRHPRVALDFRQGNTASVLAAVRAGEADLGLIEGRAEGSDLDVTPIGGDRLVLLVGRDHPWRGRKRLGPDDLAGAAWVLREPGSGTRATVDEALAALGIGPVAPVLELPSNEACIAAIETGRGVSVLSDLAAAPHCRGGRVVEAPLAFPARRFTAIRHRPRHPTRAAQKFLAMLGAEAARPADHALHPLPPPREH